MKWYAIRTVYFWGQKSDRKNVFEERVVAFKAQSEEKAYEKAREESEAYASKRKDRKYEIYPERVGYRLDEKSLIDGYEVWSEMFESDESLEEFYKNRYLNYEYHPD